MKTFKQLRESLKDSCWKGYEAIGTKKKNGKTVPNCVPTKEDTSWYPKKGFPKEGEYGYHPNPGLKPQESDKDQDMDVAYKKENEREAKKLPNAIVLQVSNKIEKVKSTPVPVKESYEEAQKHLDKASKALETSDMHAHHQHMANHFELLGKWHESKGRGRSAQNSYDKAEEHHEKSLKEEIINERGEDAEQIDEINVMNRTISKGLPPKSSAEMGRDEREAMKKWSAANPPGKYDAKAHMKKVLANLKNVKEEAEQLDERGEDSKGYKRPTEDGAGLTAKGAKAMGVKTAVTTPPSKLDPEGKAAKRRKSFCARMSGMKGPMKDEKGRPTRKAMSLRRWNCN